MVRKQIPADGADSISFCIRGADILPRKSQGIEEVIAVSGAIMLNDKAMLENRELGIKLYFNGNVDVFDYETGEILLWWDGEDREQKAVARIYLLTEDMECIIVQKDLREKSYRDPQRALRNRETGRVFSVVNTLPRYKLFCDMCDLMADQAHQEGRDIYGFYYHR